MATPRTGRPHGGARAGAGRPQGAKTKVYKPHVEKLVAAGGRTPVDVLLHVMRLHFRARRWDQAAAAAERVAPYIHPRLSASAITVRPRLSDLSDEELAAFLQEVNSEMGQLNRSAAKPGSGPRNSRPPDLATAKPRGTA